MVKWKQMVLALSVLMAVVMTSPLARFADFMDGQHYETGTTFILSVRKVSSSYQVFSSSGLLKDSS